MSITKIPFPNPGTAALFPDDYNKQNAVISPQAIQGLENSILVSGATINDPPLLKQGAYVRHNNFIYMVDTDDYAIDETDAVGEWIKLEGTGDTLLAKWTDTTIGFSYDPVRNGFYDTSNNQIIRDYAYIDGSNYIIGFLFMRDLTSFNLVDGRVFAGSRFVDNNTDTEASGTQSVNSSAPWTIPKGTYTVVNEGPVAGISLEYYNGTAWVGYTSDVQMAFTSIISSGSNFRVTRPNTTSTTVRWIKHK